jgi:hypothetical protein
MEGITMKNLQSSIKSTAAVLAALTLAGAAVAQTASPIPAPMQPSVPAQTGRPVGQPAGQTMGQPMTPPEGQAMGTPLPGGTGLPPPPQVRQAGSVDYMNGGAGEEARAVMDAKASQFSLHNVFSGKGGEYVVARKVTITPVGARTGQPITIDNAGPILMVSLPPGSYTVEADVDGKMQKKTVKLAGQPVKLNWNWPGA